MTKEQFNKILEPFTENIEIIVLDDEGYKYNPAVYYNHTGSEAIILLSKNHNLQKEKTVKLVK